MLETNVAYIALHVLLQTTFLIAVAALALRTLVRRQPAAQSVILRVTLVAVLICPCLSLILGQTGVTRFALLPAWQHSAHSAALAPENIDSQIASLPPGRKHNMQPDPPVTPPDEPMPLAAQQAIKPPEPAHNPPLPAPVNTQVGNADSPATTNETAPSLMPILNSGVLLLWLAGSLFLLSRIVRANLQGVRVCRDSQPASAAVQQLCDQAAALLNLRAPRVRLSPHVHSPCLVGWRHPLILLPTGQIQSDAALQDVILHELAHLARRDCLFHLLSRIATAVLFFQPLTWWLSRKLDRIADDLCDDYVIHYGSGRRHYANTLVDYAEQLPWQTVSPEPGLAMVSSRSSLSRRILRIMDSSRTLNLRLQTSWILLIALCGLSATATAAVVLKDGSPDLLSEVSTVEQTLIAAVESPAPTDDKASPAAASKDVKAETQNTGPVFQFQGRVLNTEEQPVAQAKLFYHFKTHPELIPLATTDAQGKYEFSIPPGHPLYDDIDQSHGMILVKAPGYGLGFKTPIFAESSGVLWQLSTQRDPHPEEQGGTRLPEPEKPITYRLLPDDVPLTGRIVDSDGQPVEGATVKVTYIVPGGKARMDEWEAAVGDGTKDYFRARSLLGLMTMGSEISELQPAPLAPAVTDAQGRFQISGIGDDRLVQLQLSGARVATARIFARTRPGKKLDVRSSSNMTSERLIKVYPARLTYVAGPSIPVTGVIRDAKTGTPIAGATLISNQLAAGGDNRVFSRDLVRTVADAEGRYRLEGLPIGKNRVYGLPPRDQPYLTAEVTLETQVGLPQLQRDIRLTPGIWVEGRAYDRDTGEPIRTGQVDYFAFHDNPHLKQMPEPLGLYDWYYRLDQEGKYRIPVLPGRGIIAIKLNSTVKYQRGRGFEKIAGWEPEMGYRTDPYIVTPLNYHYLAEVNPESGRPPLQYEPLKIDFPFQADRTITVQVVDQAGLPVTGGQYYGLMETVNNWVKVKGSSLRVRGYRPGHPRRIQYFNPERQLAGFMVLKGEIPDEVTLTLQPGWATVKGRLVDKKGKPRAGAVITNTYSRVNYAPETGVIPPELTRETDAWNRQITNANGEFTLTGLALNCKYTAGVIQRLKNAVPFYIGDFNFETNGGPGQVIHLGDIQVGNN